MKLPQTILIQETNFSNAWARAVRQVLRDGYKITIGDTAEPKPVRDACVLIEYIDKPERERFSYLYFERLSMYEKYVDQLDDLRWQLSAEMASGISTNRHQAITWKVQTDLLSPSPPCLQRIWIRYLGDDCVEVHMDWRSREYTRVGRGCCAGC
jgi:thymidylate synthase